MKRSLSALRATLAACVAALTLNAKILDNFDDNTKTGWTEFNFDTGFGVPVEQNGEFKFEIPGAVLQQVKGGFFSAGQKISEAFELKEGRRLEFRVDVKSGGAKDSFAILAFLPTANSPGTLAGYSIAKSTTDVLITKGIGKYFVADASAAAELKNENVTLVLSLTALNGSVTINARVLDKEADNTVIWEKTVVDTAAADVLAAGSDNPATPYLGSGYFTLFCYADYDANAIEDPYTVTYDNAEVYVTDLAVLDDFNDNAKTAWKDFNFDSGFGVPVEESGEFKFELPGAVLQQIKGGFFSASQKISREFPLVEGERVEFSVDVLRGGAKDSFAILGFLPTDTSPGALAGYSISKSTTDVLISKGINKYFVADDGPGAELKNDNITLNLALTVKDGSVIIDGRVLDKENNNAVIWQRTVVDTPAADVLAAGTDSPAVPYIKSGYFTLFLYADYDANAVEDPYTAVYDNALAFAAPTAGNPPPVISQLIPAEFASFLPASTELSFEVSDDQPLSNDKITVALNGVTYTSTNGLQISGNGNTRTVKLGGLVPNVNYSAAINVEDAGGGNSSRTLFFDTFAPDNFTIEIEDYNFDGGSFIDNPALIAEGSGPEANAYSYQTGVPGVDFNDTRTTPRVQDTLYRPLDPVRMAHTRDFARARFVTAGGGDASIFDFDVGDIAADEWLNYTRTFPAGTYEVYLREALSNIPTGESVLEEVTGDRTQPDQTTRVLGSFLGTRTGFQYRNVPLTDGSGLNKAVLQLSGPTTLRLRQVTPDPADGSRLENYMVFVPVQQTGLQRATIGTLSPTGGSTFESPRPVISAVILNRGTTVRTDSIKLFVNGLAVNPTITPNAEGASLTYNITPLPASGSIVTGRLEFTDSQDVTQTNEWSFTLAYNGLNAANRASGAPGERGFNMRVVQAPLELGALDNSLARAEDQLAPNSTIAEFVDTNVVVQVINFNPNSGDAGEIPGDELVPGLEPDVNGTHDFAAEFQAFLDLTAGVHRFGVITDDGFSIRSGPTLNDKTSTPLSFRNGGTANQTFEFFVLEAGLYPFRMVWYERGGSASAELTSINTQTGERTLINDPNSPNAIKAYTSVAAPALVVESAVTVNGTYAADATAAINSGTRTITIPVSSTGAKFFRLRGSVQHRILSAALAGNSLTLTYEP